MATSPEITQPVRVDEDALIHNVYDGPDGRPDDQSQGEFSQYLVDRMYGAEDPVSRRYTPGDEIEKSSLTFDGWLVRPRTALIATLAATVALNLAVNGRGLADRAGEIAGDVYHWFNPVTKTVPATETHTKTVTETHTYPIHIEGSEQPSDVAEPDRLSARQLVKQLDGDDGEGRIRKLIIQGEASDEWTADGIKSVGHPDAANRVLARRRAEQFAHSLEEEAKAEGVKLPEATIRTKEAVLHGERLGELLVAVQESKYGSVLSAISAYNHGDKSMSPELRTIIHQEIGRERRGTATVEVEEHVQTQKVVEVPTAEAEPAHNDNDDDPIIPLIFPIPPIPRLRREWEDPFVIPPTIEEKQLDHVWIELYEEALQRDGSVVENAWSLTRKYQALYREERITQGLKYEYLDDTGKEQSIDVLFVDRPELDPEVAGEISKLMFDISLMQGGKVAEQLDTIVILPTENTGPQRPDKIGMGIDEQLHQNVQGVALPLLGLVEMHMPLKPEGDYLHKFGGMRWVLAHEVAGHFTDVNDEARFIDKARSNRPGRTFTGRDPWLGAGEDSYATTGRRRAVVTEQFAIPRPEDLTDPRLAEEYIVNPGDPALAAASSARLRGQSPTVYGDTSAYEIHAETAAAVTTGIPIPASEIGYPDEILGDKPGYQVDAGLQHRFVTHIGAIANVDNLEWPRDRILDRSRSFHVRALPGLAALNGDRRQNRMSEDAKHTPYQEDDRRLKILSDAVAS